MWLLVGHHHAIMRSRSVFSVIGGKLKRRRGTTPKRPTSDTCLGSSVSCRDRAQGHMHRDCPRPLCALALVLNIMSTHANVDRLACAMYLDAFKSMPHASLLFTMTHIPGSNPQQHPFNAGPGPTAPGHTIVVLSTCCSWLQLSSRLSSSA